MLIPSSFKTTGDGEHPGFGIEPLRDMGPGSEYRARYDAALRYTETKLEEYLGPWYAQHRYSLENYFESAPFPVLITQQDPRGGTVSVALPD